MSGDKSKWWDRRARRSVDNLKLWNNNPRFDPSKKLITVRDFAEELISNHTDKSNFLILLKSIIDRGFIAVDPIVIWQDDKSKHFIVAEGNRRILALKLLRSPDKAPLSIRAQIEAQSRFIDRNSIEKISVCLAPSYRDAEWYVSQRHSVASTQIRWERLQQQRYIIQVYNSFNKDIEATVNTTGFKRATILEALRYVKLRDIATNEKIMAHLTTAEQKEVSSHRLNMTVLERWFGNSRVREAWYIEFNENGIVVNADEDSFYAAYSSFLKLMLTENNQLGYVVNTRTIDDKFQEIFDCLPKVLPREDKNKISTATDLASSEAKPTEAKPTESKPNQDKPKPSTLKDDPTRRQLISKDYTITSKSYKINALFHELQELPLKKYPNVAAASIRIFLELAIDGYYINNKKLMETIQKENSKPYQEITLKQKLTFLCNNEDFNDREAKKTINQLLNYANERSLNTLNKYIHGDEVDKIEIKFLNGFWNMLSPLFIVLIGMEEI